MCPNRLGGMMQPAKAAHGALLARPSWGPHKAGWLCGERRSSVVIELSCLHGSERYAACFDEVVARRARFPTCGVIRVAGYSVVWDCDPTSIFPLKSTKRSAAAILGRSAPSLFFYGALRIILLSAEFPAMFYMITSKQTFVNGPLRKIFSCCRF